MRVVPKTRIGKLEFFETHLAPWTANAVAIGTTSAAVADLADHIAAARAAYAAHLAAQDAAKAATQAYYNAIAAMKTAGGAIIKAVRCKAQTDGNGIFALAKISPPAAPAPIPAPGKPFDFKVALDGNGALTLKWKCANPANASGTIYQIWRRINANGEFVYLGAVGSRKFVDTTIPAGTTNITYQIQGVRTTVAGPWAQHNVNFGVASGKATQTFVTMQTRKAA